ncbi:hypothetical protein SK58_03873 [Enterobacter sp. BIDMC93]|uniref:hypothetical protein n=1 Tax=Enterobacter sp. BIDMC93 TaxID=1686396 RepID=UPI000651B687|nr:hypothetical protein [Enterobacter sp. BIDMC93]KLW59434.1 hypothetical protein SK58_03873 [Enterobacter sp. BIDMC93]
MIKPTTNEIYDFLNEVSGLVVHFSGCPKGIGRGRGLYYPDDLNKIIKGEVHGGISCSLIIPGDNYCFFSDETKAIGAIGVIVGFDEDGLVAVSSKDCGSYTDDDYIRHTDKKDIRIEDLRNSLTERQTYNEWIIQQNKILGIFVFNTTDVPVTGYEKIEGCDECENVIMYPQFDEIKVTFLSLKIYTFLNGSIVQLDRDTGEFIKINQEKIYR